MDDLLRYLEKRNSALLSRKTNWSSLWQDASDYILPRRGSMLGDRTPGERRGTLRYDATAEEANDMLSAALASMLTNPATIWFNLWVSERKIREMEDVKLFLEEAGRICLEEMNQSNFEPVTHELYLDCPAFGTAIMFVGEGMPNERPLYFESMHLGDCAIGENKYGRVDTLFRTFKWSSEKIFAEWGEACPEVIKKEAMESPDNEHTILHAVYPRKQKTPGKNNMPFASCWVLWGDEKKILEEGGFNEFPYIAVRWSKNSGESYGRGPGQKAMPEIKTLNQMVRTVLRAGQKAVDPPLFLPNESMATRIITSPSGISYYNPGADSEKIWSPPVGDTRLGLEMEEQRRDAIRRKFYNHVLDLKESPEMTATEVIARIRQQQRTMGPVLGRWKSDFLVPLIDRVFMILLRAGKLPPIPDALINQEIMAQYQSPIAKAQRLAEVEAGQQAVTYAAGLSEYDPAALDPYNLPVIAEESGEMLGVPQHWIRSKSDQKKIAKGREEMANKQQQLLEAQAAVEAGKGMAEMENKAPGMLRAA